MEGGPGGETLEDQQQLGSEEQLHLLHWVGLRAARLEAEMEETDWRLEEVEAGLHHEELAVWRS